MLVILAGVNYDHIFKTDRGVTQGDPVSPTIFNIVVNTVVRVMFLEVCGPQEAHHGRGWSVGEQYIVFYSDDGYIMCINPIWVQGTLTIFL